MLILRGLITMSGLVLLWQGIIWVWQLPPYILPSPLAVISAEWQMKNLILQEALPTLMEILLGFALGIGLGMLAALLMLQLKLLRLWFLPLLIISQAIPTFAIAPILVIWFGYGMASKVAITIIMIFFPITTAFYDGLKQTPQALLDLAKTMSPSSFRTLLTIRIPAALPSLASGIRIAAAIAPIGAIIGEWVGASRGLGFLMLNANARMQIPLMFAALLTLVLLAFLLYFITDYCLRRWINWEY